MECKFKHDDGKFNIVEGPDEQGCVRVQCLNCGRLYPSKKDPPRKINNPIGVHCNPARRAARLADAQAAKDYAALAQGKRRVKSCPESCLLKAKAHQAGLIAELNSVIQKAKDDELKAVARAMLNEAVEGQVDEKLFKVALELAVKQALREGREQDAG